MKPVRLLAALAAFLVPAQAWGQASPSPYTSAQRYDAMGRVTGTIAPDPDGAGPLRHAAVRNTYDGAGRLIRVEAGELAAWQPESIVPSAWSGLTVFRTAETAYDTMGRKMREFVREGASGPVRTMTEYSYDALGRLTCSAVRMNPAAYVFTGTSNACALNAQGSHGPDRITRNVYDAAGQRLQLREGVGISDEGTDATWAYNPAGQVITVIDGNGNRAELRYDGHGRQDRWTFPSATRPAAFNDATPATALATAGSVNPEDWEGYAYDAAGNRLQLRKRDGRVLIYDYDALNRVTIKRAWQINVGVLSETNYGYNLGGLQTSATFGAGGPGIFSAYDGFGRLVSSTSTMGGVSRTLSYQFDANGNRTRITHPGGVFFTYVYDGLSRLKLVQENGSAWLSGFSYGAPGPLSDQSHGEGVAGWTSYYHDALGRLTHVSHAIGGGASVTFGAGYSPASQVIVADRNNDAYAWTGHYAVSRPYTANGLNQYTAAGGATFDYDDNGNLISDGSNTYGYDVENRLVARSGGVQLGYDPLGRLYEVTGPAGTTRMLYDGDALVAEYDAAGNQRARYVHGADAGADDPLVWYDYGGGGQPAIRYLRRDRQGSIVALNDPAGAPVAINRYDEYGIPATNAQGVNTNAGRFQYTGQIWLPEIGMYHYKARIYSPYLGRFLQVDPVGYDGGINLYGYVENDPINAVDPDGEHPVAVALACLRFCRPVVAIAVRVVRRILTRPAPPSGRRTEEPASRPPDPTRESARPPRNPLRSPGAREAPRSAARGGETAAAREGRRAHRVYGERARQEGLRTGRDARLPSGREPDAIDDGARIVRELKPDTPSGRASGPRQVEGYRQELEQIEGGEWQGVVDLYIPRP